MWISVSFFFPFWSTLRCWFVLSFVSVDTKRNNNFHDAQKSSTTGVSTTGDSAVNWWEHSWCRHVIPCYHATMSHLASTNANTAPGTFTLRARILDSKEMQFLASARMAGWNLADNEWWDNIGGCLGIFHLFPPLTNTAKQKLTQTFLCFSTTILAIFEVFKFPTFGKTKWAMEEAAAVWVVAEQFLKFWKTMWTPHMIAKTTIAPVWCRRRLQSLCGTRFSHVANFLLAMRFAINWFSTRRNNSMLSFQKGLPKSSLRHAGVNSSGRMSHCADTTHKHWDGKTSSVSSEQHPVRKQQHWTKHFPHSLFVFPPSSEDKNKDEGSKLPDDFSPSCFFEELVECDKDQESGFKLRESYRGSPEVEDNFRCFVDRILASVNPKLCGFRRRRLTRPISEIFTASDEALALLFLLNEHHCWVKDTQGGKTRTKKKFTDSKNGGQQGWSDRAHYLFEYLVKEIEIRRENTASVTMEKNLMRRYKIENGEDPDGNHQRNKENQCNGPPSQTKKRKRDVHATIDKNSPLWKLMTGGNEMEQAWPT